MSMVQFLVTSENQSQKKEDALSREQVANVAVQNALNEAQRERQQKLDLQEKLGTAQSNLQKAKDDADREQNELRQQLAKVQYDLAMSTAEKNTLTKLVESTQGLYVASTVEIRKLDGDLRAQMKIATGLRDDIREIGRQKETVIFQLGQAKKTIKDQQDIITAKDIQLKNLQQGGTATVSATGANIGELTPGRIGTITGLIKEIRDNMATITVGEDDGVLKGTRFLVYRGDKLLGTFYADTVEADESAGRIEDIKGEIKGGDNVFANARPF
jgi:hypothetical protein